MKLGIAGIGSFVPTAAAVAGSVALSLLVLHAPPAELLPGPPTPPVDRGHPAAMVLPAPHVAQPHASTQLEAPRPAPTALATPEPTPHVSHPAAPPASNHRTPSPPPTQTVPTPVTQPVTTPVTEPVTTPVTQPVTTPVTPLPTATPTKTHSNNGRWKSSKVMSWKGAAAKQGGREHKGKPSWAGQKNHQPVTTTTPPVAEPPDASKTPPGQNKTPPGQNKTPPGQDKTPPGQAKKGK